jgi:hypothetical protein
MSGAVLAAVLTTAGAAAPAAAATVDAAAGLGGVVRSGRWTPVRVTVTSDTPMPLAEVVVSWGDATVRRDVVFPSAGARQLDLHVRTSDVESLIHVRLERAGTELATTSVPVRIAGDEDLVTVCVVPANTPFGGAPFIDIPSTDARASEGPSSKVVPAEAPSTEVADCTVSLAPADLPTSPRGYEAVDDVSWPLGRLRLAPQQAAALLQWQAIERLDERGDLSLTPQAARPTVARGLPSATARGLWTIAGLYLAGLVSLGLFVTRRSVTVSRVVASFAAALVVGCGTVLALGHVGPTRAVLIHHNSLLEQLPGTGTALLSMRAIAEFPATDAFELRLPAADAVIQASGPTGRPDERVDGNGFPVLSGRFGLATRAAFAAEAVVPLEILSVVAGPEGLRVTNRSSHTLTQCLWADGYTPATVATLPPGGSVTATRRPTRTAPAAGGAVDDAGLGAGDPANPSVVGPLVRCTMAASPLPLTESTRPVVMQGTTTIAVYEDTAGRAPAPAAVPPASGRIEEAP